MTILSEIKWSEIQTNHTYEVIIENPTEGIIKGNLVATMARPYHPSSKGITLKMWLPIKAINKALEQLSHTNRSFNPSREVYLQFKKWSANKMKIIRICNLSEVNDGN